LEVKGFPLDPPVWTGWIVELFIQRNLNIQTNKQVVQLNLKGTPISITSPKNQLSSMSFSPGSGGLVGASAGGGPSSATLFEQPLKLMRLTISTTVEKIVRMLINFPKEAPKFKYGKREIE
jgi:hypothetical protein